jgi:GntR family transcriptional regulator
VPIRLDDPRPPYVQLADELRQAIRAGDLKPGERLPSTRELADQYGIAAMTVTNAVRVLREEGLVIAYQGRGVFVQGSNDDRTATGASPGSAEENPAEALVALEHRVTRLERIVREAGLDEREVHGSKQTRKQPRIRE